MQQPPHDPNQPQPPHYQQPPPPSGYPAPDQTGYIADPGYAAAGAPAGYATAVLGQEDAVDRMVREQENRNKAISLGISVGIIALLMLAMALFVIPNLRPDPVELVVAASQGAEEGKIEKKQFQQSLRQKPSRPSSSPTNAISAAKASPISMPSIETDLTSPELGSSFGSGFGGGGFGDGLGGGMGVPSVMKGRCDSADRASRLRKAGGKAAMDRSVLTALRWIKEQQNEDGSFGKEFPVAMTAFALLAFSGHCETVDSPEFGKAVKMAIEYLVGVGDKGKGMMASRNDRNTSYEHGIAVYALAEAYSMNKNAQTPFKRISPTLKKALPIIIDGQTNGGGWLYSYGSNGVGDLSVAGWNMQALKAAELTGLKFSGLSTSKKKARKYLDVALDPNGSEGYYKYRVRAQDKGKLSLTGVGVLCSRMMGDEAKIEGKALDLILSKAPKKFNADQLYAWYYHSQAAFQAQGKHWRKYNDTYQQVIVDAQEKDGSWPPSPGHNQVKADGKIYSTCLCTLMLEVYYRYLPATK